MNKDSSTDSGQSFWQLFSILSAALGVPSMIIGGQLARELGGGKAITSILIGNMIFWIAGLCIISMAHNKTHAVENIKIYMGKPFANLASLILIVAFIIWYAIQTKGISESLFSVFPEYSQTKIGVSLGILAATLSVGGIHLIKRISVLTLPFLVIVMIYSLIALCEPISLKGTWGISWSGSLAIILMGLPGIVNLPTFFRHSKSKENSIVALSSIMLFHIFFQISTVFLDLNTPADFLKNLTLKNSSIFYLVLITAFAILSFLCTNLVNIYFASAAWETIIPRWRGFKEYLIIGLLGTAMFAFFSFEWFQLSLHAFMPFWENMLSSYIANLLTILSASYVLNLVMKRKLKMLDKVINVACWILGCIASSIAQNHNSSHTVYNILLGIGVTLIAFFTEILIHRTFWAIKSIKNSQNI